MIIWDHGCQDGDKITIEINGQAVVKNMALTKSKKTVPYTLPGAQNTFRLIATDSGKDCPPKPKNKTWNSAAIEIKGAVKNGRQTWNLKQGADSRVNLIFQP